MNHRKQPERRTFIQDRLDILIKRQRSGKASFNELTELDNIVNSYPEIRKRIIIESLLMEDVDEFNDPSNTIQKEDAPALPTVKHKSLLSRIKSILSRIFTSQITGINTRMLTERTVLI
jgi:hypothetical protein